MKFTDYRTFKTAIGGKLLELEIGKVCEPVSYTHLDVYKRQCGV